MQSLGEMQSDGIRDTWGGRPRSKATVLVVEDDDDTRAALADTLTDLGHSIEVRADGVAALERLGSADFDAVLTDVRMPGAPDGLQLAEWLRANRPATPVLLQTGYTRLPTGGFPLLQKPFTPEDLGAALAALGIAAV